MYGFLLRQPPCEAVSWNFNILCRNTVVFRQPPCEAVSWNNDAIIKITYLNTSASLWGCELKYDGIWRDRPDQAVSLLVRLWVEIFGNDVTNAVYGRQPPCEAVSWNVLNCQLLTTPFTSASLWGCELKSFRYSTTLSGLMSASLWGCELKYSLWTKSFQLRSQPPCEAVSWNTRIVPALI